MWTIFLDVNFFLRRLSIRKYLFNCASISSWTTGPNFLVFVSSHAIHWAAWEEVVCEKFNPQNQEEIDAHSDAHELFSKWYCFIFVIFIFGDYLQKTNLYITDTFLNNSFTVNWIFDFYVIFVYFINRFVSRSFVYNINVILIYLIFTSLYTSFSIVIMTQIIMSR